MLFAQLLGRRLSLGLTLLLGLLLLLPTTINETKITPIILFIGSCGLVYASRRQINTKQLLLLGAFAVATSLIFVGVYNTMYKTSAQDQDFVQKVTSSPANIGLSGARAQLDAVRSKLSRQRSVVVGRAPSFIEGESWVGRFDSVRMPFDVFLPNDVMHLLFGVGIGNATSTFGNGGEYLFLDKLGSTQTTVTQLIWESGVLGALFFLSFVVFVLKDALSLSSNAEWRDVATGWAGVTLITLLVCFYLSLFWAPALLALFTFFSGLVAACRVAVRQNS
jgi:hypothetical protein